MRTVWKDNRLNEICKLYAHRFFLLNSAVDLPAALTIKLTCQSLQGKKHWFIP